MAWQDFNRNMSGIGDYLKQASARQMLLEDAQKKADMELQNAIKLAKVKASAEAEADPFNMLIRQTTQGQPNIPQSEPSMVPIEDSNINIGGLNIPRETLIRGYLNKKLGIDTSPMSNLKQRKTELEIAGLEQKQETAAQKNEREADLITSTAQENLDTIEAIKKGKKYFGPYAGLPTLATSLGGVVDYKNRKIWENNINKLLSQKVVDLITTMKSASQTGATGFGQLSEKEGQLLREASTALSKDLDSDTALDYLGKMEKLYKKILAGKGTTSSGLTVGTVKRGYMYKGGNPADKNSWEKQ